ncbi:hypothetical protein Sputw3181_2102 [Shewanella sp. W3-18-1]|uniref:DUF1801 domain-containing protein n=1 Tax=Shewanella sp. (strain W3-18-1) TaxID=351745 RepID=UPI00005FC739|nr:DUF1801 domain-containing protein [Shewanella sp. W3-18-1]ABM24930.1 hypothetical protein Sputw3181_2102 [Shewanella sp. W3-18-1]
MDDVSPITQHIADIRLLSPSLAEVARDLRLLIFAVAQQAAIPVTEEIKYGGILFSTTKPFCGIFAYQQHVSLEFSAGASFQDAYSLLEGKGKFRRHIKILSNGDISNETLQKKLTDYIWQALKLTL